MSRLYIELWTQGWLSWGWRALAESNRTPPEFRELRMARGKYFPKYLIAGGFRCEADSAQN
jgi:hypothetical protein